MEQVEGFITLPIKSLTKEGTKKLDEAYEKYEELINLDIKPGYEIDEEEYAEMTYMYIRPAEIKGFKKSDDGYVDVAAYDPFTFQRVYLKFDEFVELIKANK